MSRDPVETVKRVYEFAGASWRRRMAGERDPMGLVRTLLDDPCVIEEMPEFPDTGTYRGYEGLEQWWSAWFDVYDEVRMKPREFIRAGERVVADVDHLLRSKAGLDLTYHGMHVWTVRDGRIVHVCGFRDRDAALAEVGLRVSRENVDNLQALLEEFDLEAWRRGENMSLLDPEVTYEDTNLPDHVGETYRGHEGVRRATERWSEAYEELTIELDRIVGAGDELVSIHVVRGRARHTGIEAEGPVAYLWTFRAGKVTHFRSYRDPEEALEAAGLSLD